MTLFLHVRGGLAVPVVQSTDWSEGGCCGEGDSVSVRGGGGGGCCGDGDSGSAQE